MYNRNVGGLAEWSIALVLKTSEGATSPWVRISHPPPFFKSRVYTISVEIRSKSSQLSHSLIYPSFFAHNVKLQVRLDILAHECLPMLTLACPKKLAPPFTPRKRFVSRCKDTNRSDTNRSDTNPLVFGGFFVFWFYRKIWVFVLWFRNTEVNLIALKNIRTRHFFFCR